MESLWKNESVKKGEKESLSPMKPGTLGKEIGEGAFSHVHDVNNSNEGAPKQVVKIGITKYYKPPIAAWLKLSFDREKANHFLKKLLGSDFNIMPDEEAVKNGVAEYMLMKEYFGSDDLKKRKELIEEINNPDSEFYQELKSIFKEEDVSKLVDIIEKNMDADFLPGEQTIVGHPPELTKEKAQEIHEEGKKLPQTFYIFQEKIEGENIIPLAKLSDEELAKRPELAEKLLMFSILTKKMYHDQGKLIDTRPREGLKHPFEWFTDTENILIDTGRELGNEKIYFIDTRLLWSKDQKFIGEKSLNLLEHFGLRSVNRAAKKYYNFCK
jgi:hypothetical protein